MRTQLISRAERDRIGLLVSVRSASEALDALAGGADVIDVKDPARGSLGAADRTVCEDVVRVVDGRAPVTAAGGEWLDWFDRPRSLKRLPGSVGVTCVKFGFAGCAKQARWRDHTHDVMAALPESALPVVAAYADWRSSESITPFEVVRMAAELGCPAVLVDTWDKSAGCLFDHWKLEELAQFIANVRENDMLAVIAGSLSLRSLFKAIEVEPDYVAVRGAACEGGRNGPVSRSQVAEIKSLLMAAPSVRSADVIVAR